MNNNNKLFGIILAGGSGSRLWPLSRELYPKQFLEFSEDKTLLQLTYERLKQIIKPENIITITNNKHTSGVDIQLQEIENDADYKIIGEPLAKNTAPAIALGAQFIKNHTEKDDDPVIIRAPSDHCIKNQKALMEAVMEGAEIAKQGYIVTFGIKPFEPETGYGYIKAFNNQKVGKTAIKTDCFKEKPDYETALRYVQFGDYYWNSGIFMFSLSTILKEFEQKEPDIINKIKEIDFETPDSLEEKYKQLPSISIDYAIMEKSNNIALIPVKFDWNDLGSWEAIYKVSSKNKDKNFIKGDIKSIDCHNSLIYSTSRFVSTIGITDTIVVETDDSVLVCNRKDSQKVKEVFDFLKNQNNDLYKAHKTKTEQWGSCKNLLKDSDSSVNNITITPNKVFTSDLLDKKLKQYYVTKGTALIKLKNKEMTLTSGQSLNINSESDYSIKNIGTDPLKIIEITSI